MTVRGRSYGDVMTSADPPWEPPLAGTEVQALLGALDRLRATFRWKADGLDGNGLGTSIASSTLSLGGLLKHLAAVEDFYSTVRLSGAAMDDTWADNRWDDESDWEFTSAAGDSPEELYRRYDGAVLRARARFDEALADGGLDGFIATASDDGERANVRRLLCDLLEEYGRHTGHADLLREAVDGRVGEDPPPDWRSPIVT